ncbi:MAG TPA: hypothetical protein GXX55_06275, partial [Firmicutes bacterium]|nr:hypothetical protein [Bacillota bacterium]
MGTGAASRRGLDGTHLVKGRSGRKLAARAVFAPTVVLISLLLGGAGLPLPGENPAAAAVVDGTGPSNSGATLLPPTLPLSMAGEEYRLGPGDVIRVVVYGQPDLTTDLLVGPDGTVGYPLLGKLAVSSKTTSEVAGEIRQGLTRYVKEPQVTVAVVRYRTLRVQVLGEVRAPGQYELPLGARLMDAIGLAGGWTRQAAIRQVMLVRRGTTSRIDLEKLSATGELSLNVPLEDGDLINVPVAATAVVWGEVKVPGAYTVPPGTTVVELLALAGGPLVTADLSQVQLTRPGATPGTQVVDVRTPAKAESLPIIQSGDIVFVPAVRSVTVLGAVNRPDRYALEPGASRILDVIARAGGLTPEAAADRVTVTREEADGRTRTFTLDLSPVPGSGVARDGSFLLQANDVLYVPEGRLQVLVLGQVREPRAVPWQSGMRVLDALAAVGGLAGQAGAERAILFHGRSGDKPSAAEPVSGGHETPGKPETATRLINLRAIQESPGSSDNVLLQPGDVLFVPEGTRQVAVLGEVARPGLFPLTDGLRIVDLVAQAGGAGPRANLKQVTLTRFTGETSETRTVDLTVPGGDPKRDQQATGTGGGAGTGSSWGGNLVLQPGDVLYVPRASEIVVLGAVRNPGSFALPDGVRLLDALAAAGGATEQADLARILVSHTGEAGTSSSPPQTVDLRAALADPADRANLRLSGGDVVYVPEAENRVVVHGAVRVPGAYVLKGEMRLLDVLALAGGPTDQANLTQLTLTRQEEPRKPDQGQQVQGRTGTWQKTVDLGRVMADPSSPENLEVKPGDVIYLAPAERVVVLGEVM